ncbi:hypothetical protein CLV97_108132 [Planifilum fimeticola]|jgi:ribosome biogenesis GTPase YqeH|uniref:CP-type G domain-containing protein n=1 Tax=Planifilum fimeticola TaxID=201975 RepID=A0A2T0LG38_9BACL|nr:ribosome biogenesis GTPase YqeH [Planifilum fimeticola]PRX41199.1 hypothetical protein CLV97_108132 [Planifilum fimeticola]
MTEGTRCEGCGALLQTEDPARPGYVPESALERENPVCRRCFRIRHYNEVARVEQDPDLYLQLLRRIGQTDSLVVLVTDLFDFAGSWIPGIQQYLARNDLLLLANKIDLFPKSVKRNRLREWVRRSAEKLGLRPVGVVLCSAAKGFHIDEVIDAIERHRRGRDAYVVGTTNVGKSTLINRILREEGEGGGEITTSPYPGTTLDVIRIPLEEGRALIDTPGIVRRDRLSEWVSPEDLRVIVPRREIHPRVYQLNDRQTLFFGGLVRFDFVKGPRQPFVCYVSNDLYIHRTKWEKADEVYSRHRGELLSPPSESADLPEMERREFRLAEGEKKDLVIPGLGWIVAGKKEAEIHVWAPRGIPVEVRPAII